MGLRVLGDHTRRVDCLKETYRKRFGTGMSYRQMNQGTPSDDVGKKFSVRFLFVAIDLGLRNLWVWLHHSSVEPTARTWLDGPR